MTVRQTARFSTSGSIVSERLCVRASKACLPWLLLLVAACDSWPPEEKEARKHFVENRESFERLAEKMRGTDYWRVSIRGLPGVVVTPGTDGEEQFVIDDDPEWRQLLTAVRMFMVLQEDGAVWMSPGGFWGDQKNRLGHNGFSHYPELLNDFKVCRPEYERIQCGRCAVPLGDDWFIHYVWYPAYYSEEEENAYFDGEISLEEYSASRDEADRQYHIDGYTKMGYDVEYMFN